MSAEKPGECPGRGEVVRCGKVGWAGLAGQVVLEGWGRRSRGLEGGAFQAEGPADMEALRWTCVPARLAWGYRGGSQVWVYVWVWVCIKDQVVLAGLWEALAFYPSGMGAAVVCVSMLGAGLCAD